MDKPKVKVNSEVTIEMSGKNRAIRIVKSKKIDLSKGFISEDSPLGKILIGAVEGESIDFESPSGKVIKVSILKIRENE